MCAVLGAITIAFSGIFVRLSHASPSTAAIFRCWYALPILGLIVLWENRRFGRRAWGDRRLAIAAGVFFSVDLILWNRSIADVGAGLSTVLANIQVVLVPLVAWFVLSERPGRWVLVALPIAMFGVLLISGAIDHEAYGRDPARGTIYGLAAGCCYVGFLLLLRQGQSDIRRPAGPLFDATATAAVLTVIFGLLLGDANLAPVWPGAAWLILLALSSQVFGWLLITMSLPRLPRRHDLAVAHGAAHRHGGARRADLRRVAQRPAARGSGPCARRVGRGHAAGAAPRGARSGDSRRFGQALERRLHVVLRELGVLQLAGQEGVVRREIKVTVPR